MPNFLWVHVGATTRKLIINQEGIENCSDLCGMVKTWHIGCGHPTTLVISNSLQ